MTCITLRDIISEVASKRARVPSTGDRLGDLSNDSERVLDLSWSALNRYIESTISVMGSLHVPNFFTVCARLTHSCTAFLKIGWIPTVQSVDPANTSIKKMRPCFYLSNAFSQSFGIGDRVRNLLCFRAHSDFKSVENFSFSAAAARFSNGLTKDQVFTSLRAIIQCIGEHASKHSVRIDFSVGTLFLGNHRNQFVFNKRLRNLLQPGLHEIDHYTEVSCASRLSSDIHPNDSVSVVSSSRSHSRSVVDVPIEPQAKSRSYSETSRQLPAFPSVSRQDSAYRAALQRHLSDLEIRASEAIQSRKQWDEHVRASKLLSELEIERRRKIERDNAQFLLKQISESSERKKSERIQEVDETRRLVGFPKFIERSGSEVKSEQQRNTENIRAELDNQVLAGKLSRTAANIHDKEIAIKLNESSRRESDEMQKLETAKKNTEKDVLRESWNRDISIKKCWRNIENYDMIPEKKWGVLLPRMNDDDETRSQILGGSSRRSLTGSVRKR